MSRVTGLLEAQPFPKSMATNPISRNFKEFGKCLQCFSCDSSIETSQSARTHKNIGTFPLWLIFAWNHKELLFKNGQ